MKLNHLEMSETSLEPIIQQQILTETSSLLPSNIQAVPTANNNNNVINQFANNFPNAV
jgi:hypothetical protein